MSFYFIDINRFFSLSIYTFFLGISYEEYNMMKRGILEMEWVCHGCQAVEQQEQQQACTVLLPMEITTEVPEENFDISGRDIETPAPIVEA